MKLRILAVTLTALTLSGCNLSRTCLTGETKLEFLDFDNGRWVLGYVEAPTASRPEITQKVREDFGKLSDDRIVYAPESKFLISEKIPLQPNKSILRKLKQGTQYDYYVNIKCSGGDWDGSSAFVKDNHYADALSYAEIICEVYDLNTEQIVYSQRASGNIDKSLSTTSKPVHNVLLKAYRKLIKDVRKRARA